MNSAKIHIWYRIVNINIKELLKQKETIRKQTVREWAKNLNILPEDLWMANKQMKKDIQCLYITEVVKAIMRYHYMPLERQISKMLPKSKVGKCVEQQDILFIVIDASGVATWSSFLDGFYKTYSHSMIQRLKFSIFTQVSWKLMSHRTHEEMHVLLLPKEANLKILLRYAVWFLLYDISKAKLQE